MDKYRNEKKAAKKRLSMNKSEILKRGGGSAKLSDDDNFGFSQAQIQGLDNKFDCDFIQDAEIVIEESMEDDFESSYFETPQTSKRSLLPEPLPKYVNKKMKISGFKQEFYEAKLEGMKLENECKRLQAEKFSKEIKKLDLEIAELEAKSSL
jgi:hypothetical protein